MVRLASVLRPRVQSLTVFSFFFARPFYFFFLLFFTFHNFFSQSRYPKSLLLGLTEKRVKKKKKNSLDSPFFARFSFRFSGRVHQVLCIMREREGGK